MPGREEACNAGQLLPCDRHVRMKRMMDDHSFKTEKLRLLANAEPDLPDIRTRPLIAAWVSRLSPPLARRPGGGESQRPW